MTTGLSIPVRLPRAAATPPPSADRRLTAYWLTFAVSIGAFILHFLTGGQIPGLSAVLYVIGLVPCGCAWLLARTVFRERARGEIWPEVIVATLFASCLILYLDPTDRTSGLLGYISSVQALLGSGMLIMTLIEAIDGRSSDVAERRFRWTFALGYLALIGTSFLFDLPELKHWQHTAQATMATVALIGGTAAWRYRLRHPLGAAKRTEAATMSHPEIAARLGKLLEIDKVHFDAGIKVADVAARLGAPDYKVSQSIVHDLGYPNWNQLLNYYRLAEAKARLADPAFAKLPILTIAMDCGFGSLGPFNRAFKAQTGMTPSAYRRANAKARADE